MNTADALLACRWAQARKRVVGASVPHEDIVAAGDASGNQRLRVAGGRENAPQRNCLGIVVIARVVLCVATRHRAEDTQNTVGALRRGQGAAGERRVVEEQRNGVVVVDHIVDRG